MPTKTGLTAVAVWWAAIWAILLFISPAYSQEPPRGSYSPSQAELIEFVACERAVIGEMGTKNEIRSGTYDKLYGQWLIMGGKADEIIRCLVEKHGWIGLSVPDGQRRGARAPR